MRIGSRDLRALARDLPGQGITVVLFEQPWVLAGRKVATPPPTLDAGLRAAAARLRSRVPLIVGGRSAGARSAARCAGELGAVGCLALAFPLHPPIPLPDGPLDLAVEVDGAMQRFFWRAGGEWQPAGPELDASVISDEGGRGEHGSFTGAFVGLLAFDTSGRAATADFTAFSYTPA